MECVKRTRETINQSKLGKSQCSLYSYFKIYHYSILSPPIGSPLWVTIEGLLKYIKAHGELQSEASQSSNILQMDALASISEQ